MSLDRQHATIAISFRAAIDGGAELRLVRTAERMIGFVTSERARSELSVADGMVPWTIGQAQLLEHTRDGATERDVAAANEAVIRSALQTSARPSPAFVRTPEGTQP